LVLSGEPSISAAMSSFSRIHPAAVSAEASAPATDPEPVYEVRVEGDQIQVAKPGT
jgi:hypothetical protein